MTETSRESPAEIPDELVERLEDLDAHQLRTVLVYARDRLREHGERATVDEIVPEPGETIVRTTERDGYVEVVKREPCGDGCPDCPHGPYLYHVHTEPRPDGSERLRWVLLGKASEDAASDGRDRR